jgi:pheromone a factor receptor
MRRYRKNFSDILTSSNSNQTKSRFLRLFWMAFILIVVAFPTQIYVLYENSVIPMIPYSWVAIHGSDWPTIELVPSGGTVLFDRWIQIGAGFVLFVFFGLGQDAKAMYRKWLIKVGFGRCFPFLCSQGRVKAQRWSATGSNSRFSTKKLFRKSGSS